MIHPIDWLDNKVGDNEYVWQLNRMTSWQTLLQAYALTEDEKYAQKVLEELVHWVKVCPPPEITQNFAEIENRFCNVNAWRLLDVGIRAYKTFPLFMDYLAYEPFFTDELKKTYRDIMLSHGMLLEKVAPILWPNADHNHYLMEMLGLLSVALLFPDDERAPYWKELAIRELERCNAAQLTEDGGQIEGCPMYHNGCMFWFAHGPMLGKKYGFTFSKEYMNRYKKALDYSGFSLRSDGKVISWGDSTTKNNAALAAAYGFAVFDDTKWFEALLAFADRDDVLSEMTNHLWRIPNLEQLLDKIDKQDHFEINLPTLNWQKTLKQVFMRSDWTKSGAGVMFACRTPVNNSHAHIDPMGFDFTALGKPLVVDPGFITYQDNEDRYHLKSAAYHNTLTVNDKDHFEYKASFAFGPQKYGDIYHAGDLGDIKYAAAIHVEYFPVVHKRLIALYKNKFLLILDVVDNLKRTDSVQLYYHINSTSVHSKAGICHTQDYGANVVIYYTQGLIPSLLDGIVGDLVDVWHPSKRLKLDDTQKNNKRHFTTIICPYIEKNPICESLVFDGTYCEFTFDGKRFNFTWTTEGFFKNN